MTVSDGNGQPAAEHDENATSAPRALRLLRWHGVIAAGTLLLLFFVNRWYSGSGWFFWLALGWAAVFTIHYLIFKSLSADEDWAYERADNLRLHSYDHKHMDAIRGHYIKPRAQKANRPHQSARRPSENSDRSESKPD